ncbi:MAG: ATP-binding cassette domain-containing protein [Luteibaculum sp.]
MALAKAMLEIKPFQFFYSGVKEAISYPEFKLDPGESALIQGESGRGKSTLLHLIQGFLEIPKATLFWQQKDLTNYSRAQFNNLRTAAFGFASQRPLLVKALSVEQNILVPGWAGATKSHLNIGEAAQDMSLKQLFNKRVDELSLGQLQRVQLLKVLAYKYQLLLLDEPFANLDRDNLEIQLKYLERYCQQEQAALLMVAHDERSETFPFKKTYRL